MNLKYSGLVCLNDQISIFLTNITYSDLICLIFGQYPELDSLFNLIRAQPVTYLETTEENINS